MFYKNDLAQITKPSDNHDPECWGVTGQVVRVVQDSDTGVVPVLFLSPRECQIGNMDSYHKAVRADRLRKL
jgi:hypothetical protein